MWHGQEKNVTEVSLADGFDVQNRLTEKVGKILGRNEAWVRNAEALTGIV